MATYKWRADFLLPGLPIALPLTLGTIYIVPVPRDETGRSQSRGHLTFETAAHLSETEARAKALSELTPVAVAGTALGGSVGEPVVTSVNLVNRATLEASDVRIPLEAKLHSTSRVVAPDMDVATLTSAYHATVTLAPQHDVLLWHRAARWLWKANSEPDPYDHFLALWIAFNVLYGPKKTDGEPSGIRAYLSDSIRNETEGQALLARVPAAQLQVLGASGLSLNRDRSWKVADELNAALDPSARGSARQILILACLVIYAVRCAIVHEGGLDLPRDKEERLVQASRVALKEVLMHLLKMRLGA